MTDKKTDDFLGKNIAVTDVVMTDQSALSKHLAALRAEKIKPRAMS